VHAVARGKSLLSARAVRRLVSELPPRSLHLAQVSPELDELTGREREVVALVALGLTTAQIAEHLVISLAATKTHASRAMFKLGAHTRSQLLVSPTRPDWLGHAGNRNLRAGRWRSCDPFVARDKLRMKIGGRGTSVCAKKMQPDDRS
jgi:DNA-binding CsgD family transcriptional regulator